MKRDKRIAPQLAPGQALAEGVGMERLFTITRAEPDDKTKGPKLFEVAFSSETPVERHFGIETLSHDEGAINFERLENGAAVLLEHDGQNQIGVVESARLDEDKIARAFIRFSRSQRGKEIETDVEDGIRRNISVGYRIDKYEVTEHESGPDEVRVLNWTPFEVSVVSSPADLRAGFGRSEGDDDAAQQRKKSNLNSIEEKAMPDKIKKPESAPEATPAPAPDTAEIERNAINQARTAEMKRIDQIREMSEVHNLEEMGRQYIDEGKSFDDFNKAALTKIGERNQKARVDSEHDGEVDMEHKERQRFSLFRLMRALGNPNDRAAQRAAAFELEVSAESAKGFGDDFEVRGEFIPSSMLSGQRDLSVGTATAGGNLVGTDLLAQSYIEVLRNSSALINSGMTVLPGLVGNVAIPRQTAGAAATWVSAEDGDATESDPAWDQVTLAPKDLACYTEVTRRLLMQSTPAVDGLVRRDLAMAQALGIDLAGLMGSGAAGQPTGINSTAGINTQTFTVAVAYADVVAMIEKVLADNAVVGGSPRFIIEAAGWSKASLTPKQGSGVEGNFILADNDRIKGYPYTMSNQLTADDWFFGDFSQLLMGEWGGLELNVDTATHSLKGKVRYVVFKTVDVAVRHPESFCVGRV